MAWKPARGTLHCRQQPIGILRLIFIPLAMLGTNFARATTTPGVKGRHGGIFRGVGQFHGPPGGPWNLNWRAGPREGGIIGIHPEGTCSLDGRGYRPKVGVACSP